MPLLSIKEVIVQQENIDLFPKFFMCQDCTLTYHISAINTDKKSHTEDLYKPKVPSACERLALTSSINLAGADCLFSSNLWAANVANTLI